MSTGYSPCRIVLFNMPIHSQDHQNLWIFEHPVIQDKLTRIRDVNTGHAAFRSLLNEIAGLMFFQLSRKFKTVAVEVRSPLEKIKGSKLAGDKDLITTLENNKNIEIITQSSVKSISGNSALQQITIVDSSGAEKVLDVDALFIELGSKINLDYVKHLVKINTKGEIEIESGGMTSHPAIFAAGDATTIPYKQIIVACGDGSNAGLSAFNYLEKLKGKPGIRADWKKQISGQVFHY